MITNIHTTKKLEKLVKKLISKDCEGEVSVLGKWNATVFFVEKKKYWLVSNSSTKYNIILDDIKAADLTNIDSIFINKFHEQLIYDGVTVELDKLDAFIGKLCFLPTNNDRSMTGFQNQRLFEFSVWLSYIDTLTIKNTLEIAHKMNDSPVQIAKNRYSDSIAEMKKILE